MSHTKEPWRVHIYSDARNHEIYGGKHQIAEVTNYYTTPEHSDRAQDEANAERIVACVNACSTLKDPEKEIKALIDAARGLLKRRNVLNEPEEIALASALAPFESLKTEGGE